MNAAAYLLFVALVGCAGWLEVNRGAAGSLWHDLQAAYLPGATDPLTEVGGWPGTGAALPAVEDPAVPSARTSRNDPPFAALDGPLLPAESWAPVPGDGATVARAGSPRAPAAARYLGGGEQAPVPRRHGRSARPSSPTHIEFRASGETPGTWSREVPHYTF